MGRGPKLLAIMQRFERRVIVRALRKYKRKTATARALGITRPTLYDRIRLYNITKEEMQT